MNGINRYLYVARNEFVAMLRDGGVMLIMLGAIFIYSTLYTFVYRNEVVRNVPIAVVDLDGTESSREFIRRLDASPNVTVAYQTTDLEQARQLFYSHSVYGVLLLPGEYEKKISSGGQAVVSIYADASYFLMYKQLFSAATSTIGYQNIKIESARFMAAGMDGRSAVALADPVEVKVTKLYNRVEGYATFVMPAIMVLILQQTLLIGIGMVNGTMTERNLWRRYRKKSRHFSSLLVLLGKATAYVFFASIVCFLVYGVYYKILGYPVLGNELDSILFFAPYLLSVVFLGIGVSMLFRYRETAIITLVAWSVPFLLLSGVSFPMEGMPSWLYSMGQMLPSSSAITGYIRLNVMGATLDDVRAEYLWLWVLAISYFIFAVLMIHFKFKMLNHRLQAELDAAAASPAAVGHIGTDDRSAFSGSGHSDTRVVELSGEAKSDSDDDDSRSVREERSGGKRVFSDKLRSDTRVVELGGKSGDDDDVKAKDAGKDEIFV